MLAGYMHRKQCTGFGTLEIIISLMVLIPMLIGLLDFSKRITLQHTLNEASTQGAEQMMLASPNGLHIEDKIEQVTTAVEDFIKASDARANFECEFSAEVANCAKILIAPTKIKDSISPSKELDGYTVTVSYKFRSIFQPGNLVILEARTSRALEKNFIPDEPPDIIEVPSH